MRVRRAEIRKIASRLLAKHDAIQADVDVRRIAEAEGFEVVAVPPNDETVSGFLDMRDNARIIGYNEDHPLNRQRFTIAHELGHSFLHASRSVYFDERLKYRNSMSSEGTDLEEIEANLFAAELLMPKSLLEEDVEGQWLDMNDENDPELERLANRYGVSKQAMMYRLAYLGLP